MQLTLVTAGLLGLPALLVTLVTFPLVAVLSMPAIYLLLARKPSKQTDLSKSRVIITGGSSGIGLSLAIESAKKGVQEIVLIARNQDKLNKAKEQVQAQNPKVNVKALSVDVSSADALSKCASNIFLGESIATFLFCCAGEPYPAHFADIPNDTFVKLVQTNQLGAIYTVKAFLPHIHSGTITFCSSICGQIGVFGYSAYSPTKFAVRGFAETLHMELVNRPNVHVQVAYPPDTDTPGFEKENETKPEECRIISEAAGLAKPEDIARTMFQEATRPNPRFNVYFNFDGFMLAALSAGFAPVTTMGDAIVQVAGMGLFRWIALFYLQDWTFLIRRYQNNKVRK